MNLKFSLLGVAGWSGSGKTTLIERLLPLLAARGLRVNVVKSSHHDVQIEPPGKDSARARAAGAAEVMLSSPYRYMLVRELRGEAPPSLQELLARMGPADLTLVEGFRDEPIPKLEVFRPETGREPVFVSDGRVVAVASDVPAPPEGSRQVEWLDLNDAQKICDWLFESQGVSGL